MGQAGGLHRRDGVEHDVAAKNLVGNKVVSLGDQRFDATGTRRKTRGAGTDVDQLVCGVLSVVIHGGHEVRTGGGWMSHLTTFLNEGTE